jgi:oligopeptide/dipeptide ABC transporter ATP-binding protein
VSGVLEVEGLSVSFRARGRDAPAVAAVDCASFSIARGEMHGLVGESGSGKTTLARALLRLVPLSGGQIRWKGRRIDHLSARRFRPLRRELQLVFQDPASSLDPRMTIAESVGEPLASLMPELDAEDRAARVAKLLAETGLDGGLAGRYPHQLSGGQLQRAVIARALALEPAFLACDEPVSALDVSVQGQIVNLIARIGRERGLSGLFISHNLAVVARLCERLMVMFRGRIVESGTREEIILAPLHPYTRELLDSVPAVRAPKLCRPEAGAAGRRHAPLPGAVIGCAYAPRCPAAIARCRAEPPPLAAAGHGRLVACHRAAEWPAGIPSPAAE